ncbi:MAG: hypothetical protein ACUVQ8_08455 [Nitrososphaeria archaeon]
MNNKSPLLTANILLIVIKPVGGLMETVDVPIELPKKIELEYIIPTAATAKTIMIVEILLEEKIQLAKVFIYW